MPKPAMPPEQPGLRETIEQPRTWCDGRWFYGRLSWHAWGLGCTKRLTVALATHRRHSRRSRRQDKGSGR